ncbi:MAG: hypothetical protein CMJ48_07620 [Planctomycetaceae bacterium]|nr:hypothetical protein [Planctomycetaceae bacterium]
MLAPTLGSCAILVLVLLVISPAIAYPAWSAHGQTGLIAASLAGLVCLLAGIAALAVTGLTQNTPNALNGLLASILFRTMIPLGAVFALSKSNRSLAEAGIFSLFVCFYLLTLVVETLLSVRLVNSPSDAA